MFMTFGFGALFGVAVGLGRGGRLSGLTTLRFRAPILLLFASVTQALLGAIAPSRRLLALGVAYAVVGMWLLRNSFHHRGGVRLGCAVLTVGWLLNLIPIVLNGGMPVSAHGLERIDAPRTMSVTEGHFSKHVPADHDSRVSVLGDVIPLPLAASVVSIGDIVLLAGIALVVAFSMTNVPGSTGAIADSPLGTEMHRLNASAALRDVLP
jgi:hypothetical protein